MIKQIVTKAAMRICLPILLAGSLPCGSIEATNDGSIEVVAAAQEYTEEDLRLMSSIIFCEAGNQDLAGKEAVGIVVMNRVESDLFPDTIEEVLYQDGQFSPICENDEAFMNKALRMYDSEEIPEECIIAAISALNDEKYVVYKETGYDLTECLFFSRYLKNKKYTIQDHDFK